MLSSQDISNEFILTRHRNGIKLVRPEYCNQEVLQSKHSPTPSSSIGPLGELLKNNSLNLFLMNVAGDMLSMNEAEAAICGFDSIQHGLGISCYSLVPENLKISLSKINLNIMQREEMKMVDEYITLLSKDMKISHYLSVKLPFYDNENNVVGIFGCSIDVVRSSITSLLTQIIEWGIFSFGSSLCQPERTLAHENIRLTEREKSVLYLTVRGHTAKKAAQLLNLSPRTVEQYIELLKQKFGVYSKYELVAKTIDGMTDKYLD